MLQVLTRDGKLTAVQQKGRAAVAHALCTHAGMIPNLEAEQPHLFLRLVRRCTKVPSGRRMAVVLIVEDETQVLILAESVLQEAGYETASASTVAEALAIIESPARQLDLLFTDISLRDDPDGGLTIGAAFAKSRPGVPVLYTRGRGVTDGMVALFAEPNGFVAKPYTVEQLKTAVTNLVGP